MIWQSGIRCMPMLPGNGFRWGVTTKSKLTDSNGRCYIVAILVDTTEVRKKEHEMEQNKLKLEFTIDAAQIIPWEFSVVERTFYTQGYLTNEGRRVISEVNYLSYVHPEDVELVKELRQRTWQTFLTGLPSSILLSRAQDWDYLFASLLYSLWEERSGWYLKKEKVRPSGSRCLKILYPP